MTRTAAGLGKNQGRGRGADGTQTRMAYSHPAIKHEGGRLRSGMGKSKHCRGDSDGSECDSDAAESANLSGPSQLRKGEAMA